MCEVNGHKTNGKTGNHFTVMITFLIAAQEREDRKGKNTTLQSLIITFVL